QELTFAVSLPGAYYLEIHDGRLRFFGFTRPQAASTSTRFKEASVTTLRVFLPSCGLGALALLAIAFAAPGADDKKAYPALGTIERKDPRFDKLIPKDAVLEKIADGFQWAEGPVWVPDGKYLLFSDIPPNLIWKWKEGEGKSVFMKNAGYTGSKPRGQP